MLGLGLGSVRIVYMFVFRIVQKIKILYFILYYFSYFISFQCITFFWHEHFLNIKGKNGVRIVYMFVFAQFCRK